MKSIVLITFLFLVTLSVQLSAQLESIKEFPREYESQAILDLTPVWISGNEILVFYKNSTYDTIFSRRTTNLGQTWSQQKFEQIVEVPGYYYSEMSLYKLVSGRVLFFWRSTQSEINYSYSDDNGYNWVDAEIIESSRIYPTDFSLVELDETKIVLSFSSRNWNARLSTDNGETWTDEDYFNLPNSIFSNYRNPHIIKISESGDSLLGIFNRGTFSVGNIIHSILSTDGGASWSDTSRVIDTNFPDPDFLTVKAIQDSDQNIWLIYDAGYDLEFNDYSQTDVSVLFSSDNGISWVPKNKFTSYIGDDFLTGVTNEGNNILTCFTSARNKIYFDGYFGIVEQSQDTYTPPVLLS